MVVENELRQKQTAVANEKFQNGDLGVLSHLTPCHLEDSVTDRRFKRHRISQARAQQPSRTSQSLQLDAGLGKGDSTAQRDNQRGCEIYPGAGYRSRKPLSDVHHLIPIHGREATVPRDCCTVEQVPLSPKLQGGGGQEC